MEEKLEKLELVFQREYWCKWARISPKVGCPRRCEYRVRLAEHDPLEYWASKERMGLFPRRVGEENLFLRFLLEQKLGRGFLDEKVDCVLKKVKALADDCLRIEQYFSDKDGGINKKKLRRFIARRRTDRGRAVRVIGYNSESYKPKVEQEAYVDARFVLGPVKTFEKLEQEITGLIQRGRTADTGTLRTLQRRFSFRGPSPLSREDLEYIWRSIEKELRLEAPGRISK